MPCSKLNLNPYLLDSIPQGLKGLDELVEDHRDLERRYRTMKKGLDRAARIQQSLVPARSPYISGYEFAHLYRPCEEVRGDFYDYVSVVGDWSSPFPTLSGTSSRLL